MAFYVEGLYVDKDYNFIRKRVELEDLYQLPTERCVWLVFLKDFPRENNDSRVWVLHSKDYMAVKVDGDKLFLDQWDEEDEGVIVKSIKNPYDNYERIPRPTRVGNDWIKFTGILLPDAKWKEAQKIMGDLKR